MTDTPIEVEGEIQPVLEEIISCFGHLSMFPTRRPPLVVSKKLVDTEFNLGSRRRKVNMAFRVGR